MLPVLSRRGWLGTPYTVPTAICGSANDTASVATETHMRSGFKDVIQPGSGDIILQYGQGLILLCDSVWFWFWWEILVGSKDVERLLLLWFCSCVCVRVCVLYVCGMCVHNLG